MGKESDRFRNKLVGLWNLHLLSDARRWSSFFERQSGLGKEGLDQASSGVEARWRGETARATPPGPETPGKSFPHRYGAASPPFITWVQAPGLSRRRLKPDLSVRARYKFLDLRPAGDGRAVPDHESKRVTKVDLILSIRVAWSPTCPFGRLPVAKDSVWKGESG